MPFPQCSKVEWNSAKTSTWTKSEPHINTHVETPVQVWKSYISLHQKSYIPSSPSTAVNISSFIAAAGYSVQMLCCQKGGGVFPPSFIVKVALESSSQPPPTAASQPPTNSHSVLCLLWFGPSYNQWRLTVVLLILRSHCMAPSEYEKKVVSPLLWTLLTMHKGLPHTEELKEGEGGIFWSNVYYI